MGIEGDKKPVKGYERLGADVTVSVQKIENDPWAQNMLREIGKTMAVDGLSHHGSVAIHFYSTSNNPLLMKQSGAVKCQLALGETSEEFSVFGLEELVKRMRAHFKGKEMRSIDPRYKVES